MSARCGNPVGRKSIPLSGTYWREAQSIATELGNRAHRLQRVGNGTIAMWALCSSEGAARERLHIGWFERTRASDAAIAETVGIPGYSCFEVD